MINSSFSRSQAGRWRRLYEKLGWPHFGPLNRGSILSSDKGDHEKFEILKFELGEKLDLHFQVKFHCESNGDSLDTLMGARNRKI